MRFYHVAIPAIHSLLKRAVKWWDSHMDENHFRHERAYLATSVTGTITQGGTTTRCWRRLWSAKNNKISTRWNDTGIGSPSVGTAHLFHSIWWPLEIGFTVHPLFPRLYHPSPTPTIYRWQWGTLNYSHSHNASLSITLRIDINLFWLWWQR